MKAIYAFSGDPITYGHIDIIDRASKMFDEIIVAIGQNPAKKYLFTIEERQAMAIEALKNYSNVKVKIFYGMLSDFAQEENVTINIKGLRNTEDFEYEMTLHDINKQQNHNLDSVFFPSNKNFSHISSGAVKAVQLAQGDIRPYVPLNVKRALELKISQQILIGVIAREQEKINLLKTLSASIAEYHWITCDAKEIRKNIFGKKGLILIEADQFPTSDLSAFNNHVLILKPNITLDPSNLKIFSTINEFIAWTAEISN